MQGNRQNELHLVTGGGGYAGMKLGMALLKKYKNVILLDVTAPTCINLPGVTFIEADVRKYEDIRKAFDGVSCVYHMASYGMSGREQLRRKMIEEVNVTGTENVIKACLEANVARLVYTSTFNVVFGGQVIENGDETLPYFPLEKQPDYYSRTKTIAEQKILAANNTVLSGGGGELKTCALRLAGVYGPGEQRHLPRIVGYIEGGLFKTVYGDIKSKVEFLHVDNLVLAHILAGEALGQENNHIAAGQAYFISDGKPVNNFEFFRPLVEGLGYKFPTTSVPISIVYFFAFITEWVHFIVGRIYNFQPLLTRTEVFKTGVTHWFNLEKAHTQLGYIPTIQNDLESSVQHLIQHGYGKNKKRSVFRRRTYSIMDFIVDVFLVTICATMIMAFLPMVS